MIITHSLPLTEINPGFATIGSMKESDNISVSHDSPTDLLIDEIEFSLLPGNRFDRCPGDATVERLLQLIGLTLAQYNQTPTHISVDKFWDV
jgi:hypothetical protein